MGTGRGIFGEPAFRRELHRASAPMGRARETLDPAFEFLQKLGVEFYCFHDRDFAPEGESFAE